MDAFLDDGCAIGAGHEDGHRACAFKNIALKTACNPQRHSSRLWMRSLMMGCPIGAGHDDGSDGCVFKMLVVKTAHNLQRHSREHGNLLLMKTSFKNGIISFIMSFQLPQ